MKFNVIQMSEFLEMCRKKIVYFFREPSVKLNSHTYELEESGVKLKLTLCDTVGYGDQVNKDDSFKPIVDYIDSQYELYLQEELKIKRNLNSYHDSR